MYLKENSYVCIVSELYDPQNCIIPNYITAKEIQLLQHRYCFTFLTSGKKEYVEYNSSMFKYLLNSFKPIYFVGITDLDCQKLTSILTLNFKQNYNSTTIEEYFKHWKMIKKFENVETCLNLYNNLHIEITELPF